MKRVMSIAMIALFVSGASVLACDSCGCKAKKAEKKTSCSTCTGEKKADAKKCGKGCTKACCAKKAEAK